MRSLGDLLDAPLQALAFGAAGRVVVDRLVAGRGGTEDRVGAHGPRLRGVDPSHVLWIGGGQGSGKSSIARALSRRFDLQLYNVDRRTWVHEARMPTTEFGSLSMDERWVDAPPGRMVDWFVTTSRHRFRLVLEDLRDLPDSPSVIVEGPQLFPTSVAAVLVGPRSGALSHSRPG